MISALIKKYVLLLIFQVVKTELNTPVALEMIETLHSVD